MQAEFPGRQPLWLMPLNECATARLVCTTIGPTLMPQPELADLRGIVGFVSDYVMYEPLSDPRQSPAHLASPQSTLRWQVTASSCPCN